jgi:aryl carrier-like protein
MTEQNLLDSLQLTLARSCTRYAPAKATPSPAGYHNPSQIAQVLESRLPITDPQNSIIWKRGPRMAIHRNIENVSLDHGGEGSDVLKVFLSTMMADSGKLEQKDSVDIVAREIANRVSTFLMKGEEDIDLSLTLAAAGVDSLVAIEVRNWWKQNLSIDVSVLELMNGVSIQQLGELAACRLKDKFEGKGK